MTGSNIRHACSFYNSTLSPFVRSASVVTRRPSQWRPLNPTFVRRNHDRSHGDDSEPIPFEDDGDRSKGQTEDFPLAYHQQRGSSISTKERHSFESLFMKFLSEPSATPKLQENSSGKKFEDLTSLLESSMSAPMSNNASPTPTQAVLKDALQNSLARFESLEAERNKKAAAKEQEELELELEPLKKERLREFGRIEKQMLSAATDVELWTILEQHVFLPIKELKFDDKASVDDGAAAKGKPRTNDIAIKGPNYPALVISAVRQFRQNFPTSTLVMNVLPRIKALGRASYVLGASTILYNELIVINWIKYADFVVINDLLQEMDSGGVDFDGNTLTLLSSIMSETSAVYNGQHGETMKRIWSTEKFHTGLKGLSLWFTEIRRRLEEEIVRQANVKPHRKSKIRTVKTGE